MQFRSASVAALILAAAATTASAQETIYALTSAGGLISFSSASPSISNNFGGISGLGANQVLRGIDFRPANGLLYGVATDGATAQLYTIDLFSAAATAVGSSFSIADAAGATGSTRISIDFNPTVDRLRLISGDGINLRINPNTGAIAGTDTRLNFNAGSGTGTPFLADIAYTNNFVGATTTTLYGYDYSNDNLVTVGGLNGTPSPNGGLVTSVGPSGFVANTASTGFDISSVTGNAFVTLDTASNVDSLYSVNLATGAHTLIGSTDVELLDMSILIPAPSVAGLLGIALVGANRRRR